VIRSLSARRRRHPHLLATLPCVRERVPAEVRTLDGSQTSASLAPEPRPPSPPLPETIGRFQVLRELGRGGMGVVYEAHDARVDRRVAIKLVALERVGERGRARMRREARALARLSHPNVVQVFEVGEVDDALFLAMEHVEGQTLRQWVGAAPRGWREVLAVYHQAAAGLAAAHDKGLVHRDFKPDNAIIGADGRVRVIDFGLAREPDGGGASQEPAGPSASGNGSASDDALTETGAVLGTPAYMAKEQFLGRKLDARTDQFALCVSLFEALYGRRPFEGATRLALADAVTRGRMVVPPDAHGVPPWVLAALRRGLQHEPSARFPDVRALSAALEPRRRGRWIALGLVGLAVIGTSVWATTEPPPCQDAARQWATVWSPTRREAVGHALASAPVPYAEHAQARVLETLDAYGAGWVKEHEAACTATRVLGSQSTAVMDQRMACLASARRRFVALVEVLVEADAVVAERATEAASELPAVALCADEQHVSSRAPPTDPETARRVEALREDLDVAIAWHDGGRLGPARERLTVVAAEAEPLGYPPLLAEARLRLGIAQDAMGEPGAAVQTLRAAFFDARAAGLDEVAVRAATHLVFEEGYRLNRYEAADGWAEHARATLERLGGGSLEPALYMAVANVDLARSRYSAAQAGYQRAVDGLTAELGPDHWRVAQALGNLANAELFLGNLETAAALDERVLELDRRALGASHPEVSRTRFNLGSVYLAMGRYDDALEQLQASLVIDTAALGPRHPSIVTTRASIATVYFKQGELDRALAEQRELVALVAEIHGDDGVEVANVLNDMGATLRALGRDREALELLRRGVDIVEQRLPPNHVDVGLQLHNVALVENELGQYEAALGHARRTLAIYEQALPPLHHERAKSYMLLSEILESRGELAAARDAAMTALALRERGRPASVGLLASARMRAARLTWDAGGDRALARAMALLARDEFLAGGEDWADAQAEAEEWLDLHRPSP
jgi:tetratricopeptide (TPR) repeat protein/predicted Ser/Thr protein kinase